MITLIIIIVIGAIILAAVNRTSFSQALWDIMGTLGSIGCGCSILIIIVIAAILILMAV